jgi:mannose-6-phosphate isomerase-like protein (cupin superfamily)
VPEVLSGNGTMKSGDLTQELSTGTILTMALGTPFSLESRSAAPLVPPGRTGTGFYARRVILRICEG